MAGSGTTVSAPLTATLTIVPVTLSASATTIPAGKSVTLSYSGPNNNSTWTLNMSSSDNPIPLAPAAAATTCSGTYQTGPLAAATQVLGFAHWSGSHGRPGVLAERGGDGPAADDFDLQRAAANRAVGRRSGSLVDHDAMPPQSPSIMVSDRCSRSACGSYCCVYPTQTTTYTATATPIYPGAPPVTATATVTVSTGGLSNLNHIIYMLQENRAFDNYFGQLAEYRVNHNPPIQGAQLSDVNDLHTLPSDYQICNPNNQCFGPFHARTECIENLSPSWDETHYDMDLVGGDWLNLTQNSVYKMDRFLETTGRTARRCNTTRTHTRPLGLLRPDGLAVLL